MADNIKAIKTKVDQKITNANGAGSILATDHNDILTDLINKAGKYTGFPFRAIDQGANGVIPTGTFSWNQNLMSDVNEFVITISTKTADLNLISVIVDNLRENDVIHFKDFLGRSVFLTYVNHSYDQDTAGSDICNITVKGFAENINYTYQAGEIEPCIITFYKNTEDSNVYDVQFNGNNFVLLENGVPKTTIDLSIAITETIVANETNLADFATNNASYTYQQGDVISIVNVDGALELYMFKGGGKSDVSDYLKIDVSKVDWSNILNRPINLSDLIDDIGATEKEIIKVTEKSQLVNQDLDNTKVYYLLKDISLLASERIRVNNLQLLYGLGHDIVTISTSEPNSVIFESTGTGCGDVKIYSLSLVAGGTGSQPFNVKDVDGTHEVRLRGVNFNGCQNLGVFDGFRQGFWDDIGFYGCQDGIELKGSWSGFKLFNSNVFGFASTGNFLKKGTGLVFSNRFFLSLNFDFPIGAILTDFEESNFTLNELFQINSTIAKRDGVLDISNANILIPNLSANSVKSLWIGNIGLPDTATEVFVEDANVAGNYVIDWLQDTYFLTMTADTTFTELNIPASGKNTQEIKIYLTGNFVPTFPVDWTVNQVGTYKGVDVNEIAIKFIKSGLYFLKISNTLSTYPAPTLKEIQPVSLIPNTTDELRLIGGFYTPESIVSIEGQTVNSVEYDGDTGDLVCGVTTGSVEDDFNVIISNGTTKLFIDAFLVSLGDVFIPTSNDYTGSSGVFDNSLLGQFKTETYGSQGSAIWTKEFDFTKDFIIRFEFSVSNLGYPIAGNQMGFSLLNVSDDSLKFRTYIFNEQNNGYVKLQALTDTDSNTLVDYKSGIGVNPGVDFMCAKKYEVRHIGGVLYYYINNVLRKTFTAVLTENVRMKIEVQSLDLKNIKYIELP